MAVGGDQLGVVEGDLVDGAGGAGHLHEVPDGERAGGEDYQSAGHVAQDVLRRQGDAQGAHRQQCHQGRHWDVQALCHDDHGHNIQKQLQRRQGVSLDTLIQPGPGQKTAQQLAQNMDCHKADQQCNRCGEDGGQREIAQGTGQGRGNIVHKKIPLSCTDESLIPA
jgi:hypothetical protein